MAALLPTLLPRLRAAVQRKLHDWGWNWQHSDWRDWHTFIPVASSAVAHAVFIAAAIGVTAAFAQREEASQPRVLQVDLLAAATPPPLPQPEPARPLPRAQEDAAPAAEHLPATPPLKKQDKRNAPSASAPTSADSAEGVYLPPSPLRPGVAGLQGFAEEDPCKAKGLKLKDCPTEFAGRFRESTAWNRMSAAEKETYFGDYIDDCPYRVGCDGGEWISLAGTRGVGKPPPGSRDDRGGGTPMAMGAAGLGGINDLVGRLGFNPDHTDPGFGD